MKVSKVLTVTTVLAMFSFSMFSLTSCTNESEAIEQEAIEQEEVIDEEEPQDEEENAEMTLTDAQIASIAVVANQIDVDYGKIALEKATDDEAKKFAQTMIDDHEAIINVAVELAGRLGVTPDNDNDITKSLLEGAEEMTAKLSAAEGEEFNKIYIDNEVAYHAAVIDAVKNVLIPQTENEELKATLESVVPNLEHHLEMAKMAQENLNK